MARCRACLAGGKAALDDPPWKLLCMHSARLDAGSRDREMDEAPGLNTAWYAAILLTLTET